MGLFDKKYCGACGNQIKFLGGRKVDDGVICKDCNNKLSPYFTGRRKTSLNDIKEQLAYRENNAKELLSFNATKVAGKGPKVYVDENKGKFIISRTNDYIKENCDLIDLSSIIAFNTRIKEEKEEIYDVDKEGNNISYKPPRFEYEYDFEVEITLNHPYIDEITFSLTGRKPDNPDSAEFKEKEKILSDISEILTGKRTDIDKSELSFTDIASVAGQFISAIRGKKAPADDSWYCPKCGTSNTSNFCMQCGTQKPVMSPKFCPDCGYKFESGKAVKFCPQCGKKF
ncbi:MAG: DUF4428 domain-containing protein [Erysipelotrichaceae bacterium]|jgi:rubrerythrin